jgi:homocitrate synthase NifV
MPGVEFSAADGVVIARMLNDIGIDTIEVGIVSDSYCGDIDLCRAVLGEVGPDRSMTVVQARSRPQVARDLELVVALGFSSVMLSIPTSVPHCTVKLGTSSRQRVLALAASAIGQAKDLGLHTVFSAEDGARTEPEFLVEYVRSGAHAGADRFRLAETVSVLRPGETHRLVAPLVAAAGGMDVEIHSHNMLGLAVANALAAAEAGARWISVTVGGLGERGGNTPLGEVLACMWRFWGDRRYDLSLLTRLTREVGARSQAPFGASAGPTAELAYSYEVAGQWLNPDIFEAVPADVVGNPRAVRVGGRLKPPLLRACLPPELLTGHDLDVLAAEVARRRPDTKSALGIADLTDAVEHYAAGGVAVSNGSQDQR